MVPSTFIVQIQDESVQVASYPLVYIGHCKCYYLQILDTIALPVKSSCNNAIEFPYKDKRFGKLT